MIQYYLVDSVLVYKTITHRFSQMVACTRPASFVPRDSLDNNKSSSHNETHVHAI